MVKKQTLKGYMFEALTKELIRKAGFKPNYDSEQLTATGRRFHGRGATHQIDVFGEFYFSIPLIYPINILGEAKAYKRQVGLGTVRNFCGVAKDIIEWYSIDTKGHGKPRFSKVAKKRNTHCPVIFSLNGFSKNAIEFAFVQGITPVTYEKHHEILKIYKKFSGLAGQINIKNLKKTEYKYLKYLETFAEISTDAKKEGFDIKYQKLMESINKINSYIGMLGGEHICNIISLTDKIKQTISPIGIYYNNSFFLTDKNGNIIGEFSLSRQFIKYWLDKPKNIKKMFSFIDIFLIDENEGRILKLKVAGDSLLKLTEDLLTNENR